MRKVGSFVYLSCLLLELWSLKCQKWPLSYVFCWWQQKINHSLGKIFQRIWKILFHFFRKCYGLLVSQLPLARYRLLKIEHFGMLCRLRRFFYISTLNILLTASISQYHPQYLTNHIIFWKNSMRFSKHLNLFPKLWLIFCCHQQKIQKMSHF